MGYEHEKFRFLVWQWDIAAAHTLTGDAIPITVDVASVAQMLTTDLPDGSRRVGVGVDRAWVDQLSDERLADPVLCVSLPNDDGTAGVLVIDGWHRVAAAAARHVATLPGLLLTDDAEEQVRLAGPPLHAT